MGSNITNIRIAAACTASTLGIATISFTLAAVAATASTTAMVAYTVLAVLSAGLSISSLTAWASDDSKDVASYFSTLGKHALFAIPAVINFVGQVVIQALVKGIADGVSKALSRKIAGPDHTAEVTHKKQ